MKAEVFIDISRLLARASQERLPTGVDRVCLAYIQRWHVTAQAIVQKGSWRRLMSYETSQTLFALLLDSPRNFAQRANWVIAKACIPPWPLQDAGGKPCLYLGHSGIETRGFAHWLYTTRQKPVYFVHDLIPITHAEYCRAGEKVAHAERISVMLTTGSGLIGNSRFTLDALETFACGHGIPMPPTVMAPLAPASLLGGKQDLQPSEPLIKQPYFVVLGTIEPRKNHLLLLNIWRELVALLGDSCPHLLIIGQRGWECENVVDMLERCEVLKPFVHELAACPDTDLACYLKHAQALLFPSFVEGYGMPLVEALMLGAPVVASDLSVFREIAGDVPDFLNPIDGSGWLQAVLHYSVKPSARREAQLQRMQAFNVPAWDDHFAQVETLMDRLGPSA